ncbi:MAG: hypothetical protein ACK557_13615, partial [Planctomycetota bacterium]
MKPKLSAETEIRTSAGPLPARVWTRREWLASAVGVGLVWPQFTGCAWNCPPPTECRDVTYLKSPEGFSYFFDPLFLQRRPRRVL